MEQIAESHSRTDVTAVYYLPSNPIIGLKIWSIGTANEAKAGA